MVIEVKNSVAVFLGLVLVVIIALLPGKLILGLSLAGLIIGALILSWRHFLKVGNLTAVAVVIAIAAIAGPVLLLLLILIAALTIAVIPTAINFAISYLVVQALPLRGVFIVPVFLITSLLLAFNVRLPAMVNDWTSPRHEDSPITEAIQLSQDEPLLLVSNVSSVSFRASPNDSISLGGNEGCTCLYWVYPRMIIEGVEDALQRRGIRYTKHGKARYRLVVDARESSGITLLDISLWDGAKRVSDSSTRLRSYYPHEEAFGHSGKSDVDFRPHRLLFLAQNTLWNHAASMFDAKNVAYPIRGFLDKAIKAIPDKEQLRPMMPLTVTGRATPLETFPPFIGKKDYEEMFSPEPLGCGTRVATGLRYDSYQNGIRLTGRTLTFTDKQGAFTVLISRNFAKVVCAKDVVYAIGDLDRQEVRVQKFSPRGHLLTDHVVALPGMADKRVVDFVESEQGYEFALLELAPENYHFAVRSAFRVHVPLRQ